MMQQSFKQYIQAFKARLLKSIKKQEEGIYRYEQIKKKRPKAELKELHGQFELPTTSRPISGFIGSLLGTLICNGFTAVSLVWAIATLLNKNTPVPGVFIAVSGLIILIPFVFIGLFLILCTLGELRDLRFRRRTFGANNW